LDTVDNHPAIVESADIPAQATSFFDLALRHHQAGELSKAETYYRKVLAIHKDHKDSLHLLGVVAHQVGRHRLAVDLIGKAIRLDIQSAPFHNNIGLALRALGDVENSSRHYAQALTLQPDFVEAHYNLGKALGDKGKLDTAKSCATRALILKPDFAEAHYALASATQKQGNAREALQHYQRALALKPAWAEVYNNLGNLSLDRGTLDAAVDCFHRTLAVKPAFAEAHNNLGSVLRAQGELAKAVVHYARALTMKPGLAEAYNNLGSVLRAQGKPPAALIHYQRAVGINREFAEAHSNLASALCEEGKWSEAFEHCQRALYLKPELAEALNNLGCIFKEQNKMQEAETQYRRALAAKPDYAEAQHNLSTVLMDQGRLDEALARCEEALSLRPDFAEAYSTRATMLRQLGHLEDARRASEKAIQLAPHQAGFYLGLISGTRVEQGNSYLAAMETLAEDIGALPENEQGYLHFALSKAYSDTGQHERSFTHLLQGNALKRQSVTYDEKTVLGLLDRMRAAFNAEMLSSKHNLGHPSSAPIFIVGMPRSGTTLIEQILASHSKVFGAGELEELTEAIKKTFSSANSAGPFPDVVSSLDAGRLRKLGATYLSAVSSFAPSTERFTDKMPRNFAFAGLIHLALPNARIIHAKRDPLDTCLSCFSILFRGTGLPYTYDLGELGRYYRAYEALMDHWRQVLPPGVMLEVQYEEVVADLEGQARRILAHCNLEWEDACLAFYEAQRPVRTASVTQVRQPIYHSSVGRWRPYRPLLQPLIETLGIVCSDSPGRPTG
jgi:tetratricopeptide (TPR) repeat protein